MLSVRLLPALCLILSLAACSSARYEQMIPNKIGDIAPTHRSLTVLPVRSSIKTDRSTPLEKEIFQQALAASLAKSGMFKQVQSETDPKGYKLETSITFQKLHLDDSVITYTFAARYGFVNRLNQVLYTTDVRTQCTKTAGDHSVGATRERRAIECAVKDNIAELLDRLYTAQHNFR